MPLSVVEVPHRGEIATAGCCSCFKIGLDDIVVEDGVANAPLQCTADLTFNLGGNDVMVSASCALAMPVCSAKTLIVIILKKLFNLILIAIG